MKNKTEPESIYLVCGVLHLDKFMELFKNEIYEIKPQIKFNYIYFKSNISSQPHLEFNLSCMNRETIDFIHNNICAIYDKKKELHMCRVYKPCNNPKTLIEASLGCIGKKSHVNKRKVCNFRIKEMIAVFAIFFLVTIYISTIG